MYKIALIASSHLAAHAAHLTELLHLLDRPDVSLWCDRSFHRTLVSDFDLHPTIAGYIPADYSPLDMDFVISLGGEMVRCCVPLVGSLPKAHLSWDSIWGDWASSRIAVSRRRFRSCLDSLMARIRRSAVCFSLWRSMVRTTVRHS